jgi:hypothetical protein
MQSFVSDLLKFFKKRLLKSAILIQRRHFEFNRKVFFHDFLHFEPQQNAKDFFEKIDFLTN